MEAVRRGGRDPRRRRAARGGVPAGHFVRHAARRARARGGDARDDRRPVPRHHRHRARRGDAAPAEDRLPVLCVRSDSRSGLRACPRTAARLARVRRRARPPVPDRRRHPRRRRLRRTARRRRRPHGSPTRLRIARAAASTAIDADTSRAARDRRRRSPSVRRERCPPASSTSSHSRTSGPSSSRSAAGCASTTACSTAMRIDEMCSVRSGQVLAPWPNRIPNGSVRVRRRDVPARAERAGGGQRDPRPRALGELARGRAGRRARRDGARPAPAAGLSVHAAASRRVFELDADGLTVRTTRRESRRPRVPVRRRPPPVHRGPTGRVDDLVLEIPGRKAEPIGRSSSTTPSRWTHRGGWSVGDVTVWADDAWKHVQLFTGDARPDVARRCDRRRADDLPAERVQHGRGPDPPRARRDLHRHLGDQCRNRGVKKRARRPARRARARRVAGAGAGARHGGAGSRLRQAGPAGRRERRARGRSRAGLRLARRRQARARPRRARRRPGGSGLPPTSARPPAASPTSCCSAAPRASIAIDVGYGQLHPRLRHDPRVVVLERTNARELDELPFAPQLVVCDVSFISVRTALPPVLQLAAPGWQAVVLVKPQFEAGRSDVGKGGVVRDHSVRARVLREVAEAALGWGASAGRRRRLRAARPERQPGVLPPSDAGRRPDASR